MITINHNVKVNIQAQVFLALMDFFSVIYFAVSAGISFAFENYIWGIVKILIVIYIFAKNYGLSK